MAEDTKRALNSAVRLTLTVLGLGLLASVAVGLVYGLIIDDLAGGLGQTVAIGMTVAALIGVTLNLLWPSDHSR
ncbi:MAG TPA: hypothetical protein VF062_18190 [Candidatus Limnocylindrales bacterium]